MADIKTKDAVKGTIKTIDKAAIAGQRMKQTYVQTKEKAEHSTHAQENSAEEYAADRVEGGIDRVTHEAVYQFDKQGRKGVEATKQNISKAKDGIRQFKEKRTAETLKNQSIRIPRNKGVKAVQETQKRLSKPPVLPVRKQSRPSGKALRKRRKRRSRPLSRPPKPQLKQQSRRQRRLKKQHRLR